MKTLSIAVAALLGFIDTTQATEYYLIGKGVPTNYSPNIVKYLANASLEETKEACNNLKGCTSITWDTKKHWANLNNNESNAFSLFDTNTHMVTYSKTPLLEKLVDRTCGAAASRIHTLKGYLKTEKNFLG